jgi:hypothetical protein
MSSIKMLLAAMALTMVWGAAAAWCFSSIATVPENLAVISHQRAAPVAPVLPAHEAPPMSVATATAALPAHAAR